MKKRSSVVSVPGAPFLLALSTNQTLKLFCSVAKAYKNERIIRNTLEKPPGKLCRPIFTRTPAYYILFLYVTQGFEEFQPERHLARAFDGREIIAPGVRGIGSPRSRNFTRKQAAYISAVLFLPRDSCRIVYHRGVLISPGYLTSATTDRIARTSAACSAPLRSARLGS